MATYDFRNTHDASDTPKEWDKAEEQRVKAALNDGQIKDGKENFRQKQKTFDHGIKEGEEVLRQKKDGFDEDIKDRTQTREQGKENATAIRGLLAGTSGAERAMILGILKGLDVNQINVLANQANITEANRNAAKLADDKQKAEENFKLNEQAVKTIRDGKVAGGFFARLFGRRNEISKTDVSEMKAALR